VSLDDNRSLLVWRKQFARVKARVMKIKIFMFERFLNKNLIEKNLWFD